MHSSQSSTAEVERKQFYFEIIIRKNSSVIPNDGWFFYFFDDKPEPRVTASSLM